MQFVVTFVIQMYFFVLTPKCWHWQYCDLNPFHSCKAIVDLRQSSILRVDFIHTRLCVTLLFPRFFIKFSEYYCRKWTYYCPNAADWCEQSSHLIYM